MAGTVETLTQESATRQLSLSELIARHGGNLLRQAHAAFPPAVRVPDPSLSYPGRKPMGAQALTVSGAVHAFRRGERAVFIVGEMGTGKTFMGIATALNAFPGGRYLVLCPPHLVEKWAREARMEGAEAVILQRPADLSALQHRRGPLFAILSRERAKLGPGWAPALAKRLRPRKEGGRWKRHHVPACPTCARPLDAEEEEKALRHRTFCQACGGALWQETPPRRESLYHALRRTLPKGFFQLLLLDEAHEYKGGGTAQALAAAGLMDWVGRTLLLTGTLFGGYASGLYHLLKRTLPEVRETWPEEREFVAQFGLLERIERRELTEDGRYTRRRESRVAIKERPGLSPLLLPLLLPQAGFVRLGEVAEGLPPYGEEVVLLEMDPEHRQAYLSFQEGLAEMAAASLRAGSKRYLGALVQAGIQVPDTTWQEEVVEGEGRRTAFPGLPPGYRHAKERHLAELVRAERDRGRRVLVYVQGTGKRDQIARLVEVLREAGLRAEGLRADTVAPDRREAWIAARVDQGLDALVLHPRIVQTGLDLVDFPTIVWYQPEYSVFTLRQASRRSWRIGQHHPVRVVFLAYRNTLQEAALGLMGQKTRASLALEGELVEGGLVAQADEDPTLALAKALAGATQLSWHEIPELKLETGNVPMRRARKWAPGGGA